MNPADQRFEQRFYKRLRVLEQQMQDIKTAQSVGFDSFEYDITDLASYSVYLPTGGEHIHRINFNADSPKYYAGEISMSFFFNNDFDADYHWPDGAALTPTSNLQGFDFFLLYDYFNSDETGVGRKTYYLRTVNYGAVAKTIHHHIAQVFPKGAVS